jgi:hypothetical protein
MAVRAQPGCAAGSSNPDTAVLTGVTCTFSHLPKCLPLILQPLAIFVQTNFKLCSPASNKILEALQTVNIV